MQLRSFLAIITLLVLGGISNAFAESVVMDIEGSATTLRNGQLIEIKQGSDLHVGEMVATAAKPVRITFQDGTKVTLRPYSQTVIEKFKFSTSDPDADSFVLRMVKGGFRAVTGLISKKAVSYTTPTATIGIRGTDFTARYCQADCQDLGDQAKDGLIVEVTEGEVSVDNEGGTIHLGVGQAAYSPTRERAPIPIVPIPNFIITMPGC